MKYSLACFLNAWTLMTFCQANEEYNSYLSEWKTKCASLLEEWHKPENKNNTTLKHDLIESAVRSEQPEIVEEISVNGDVAAREIKWPHDTQKIEAKRLLNFEEMPTIPCGNRIDCVIRRMTKTYIELWTPKHGWLFNANGKLVNEALPPRRDGIGRSWHGAFLPDGCWITTDLWAEDKTLTFFSPTGKWLKEIKVSDLAPIHPDEPFDLNLIGWARCDKDGKGWIVSVGDGPGRAHVFIKPEGKADLLENTNESWDKIWKLCYLRDLEPKGMYTQLVRYSDDCKRKIDRRGHGHGIWVGYPTFTWSKKEEDGLVIPGDDHNFGFLPGSLDVFIGASDPDNGDPKKIRNLKTWFFDSEGKCRGWIRAAYLTDSADGKTTWYLDEENGVVNLGTDLKPQSHMTFIIDGAKAKPVKLFTDLHLGFFRINKQWVLARW